MEFAEIVALITGLIGLITTGIGAFYSIKNWISVLKTKNGQEVWTMVMEMADAAMKEAEASGKSGEDKKKMVIDTVSASLKAAGLDIAVFTGQLNDYIDQTIKFVNDITKK